MSRYGKQVAVYPVAQVWAWCGQQEAALARGGWRLR